MEVGKLIERFQEESFELYNPKSDPGESENLAASQAETAEEFRTVLFDCQSVTNVRRPPEKSRTSDQESPSNARASSCPPAGFPNSLAVTRASDTR